MKKQKVLLTAGVVIAAISLIVTGLVIYHIIQNSHVKQTIKKTPVISGFHSPNKYQEDYGFGYQVDNTEVILFQGDSSYNANQTPKQYGFSVWYVNSLDHPANYPVSSLKSLDIGCIASNNQTYKQNPSIFSGSLNIAAPNGMLSLDPFEIKKVPLQVSPDCQYVGTADGKYWWNVPQFGQ